MPPRLTQPEPRDSPRSATLVGMVANAVRADIVSGVYTPGARLNIDSLAERFGISIIPVREALRGLATEGLVTREVNKGYRVRAATPDDFAETYRLRALLEPLAVFLAVPNMVHADFGALDAELEALTAAEDRNDVELYYKHHLAFHFGIYQHCHQPWLLSVVQSLYNNSDRYRAWSDAGLPPRSPEHGAVLKACRAGKASAAARLMERHLRHSMIMRWPDFAAGRASELKKDWPRLEWPSASR